MQEVPQTVTQIPANQANTHFDPIIEREDVMWAARRFILIYGVKATEVVHNEVHRLDMAGKLHVAEMFTRVEQECVRLLSKSEKLRLRKVH